MGTPKTRLDEILESKSRGRLADRLARTSRRRALLRAYNANGVPDFEILRVVPTIYQSLVELTDRTAEERKKYLHSQSGRVEKELFVSQGRICLENAWGKSGLSAVDGKFIFVLSPDGRLFGQQEPTGLVTRPDSFTHACFLAGTPCKAAGEIFVRKGRLIYLNNSSGHYLPHPKSLVHIVDWLKAKGISQGGVICLHASSQSTVCDLMSFSPDNLPSAVDNGSLERDFHLGQVKSDAVKNKVARLSNEIDELVWNDGDVEQKCRELYLLLEIDMAADHPMSYVVLGVMSLAIARKIDYFHWQAGA